MRFRSTTEKNSRAPVAARFQPLGAARPRRRGTERLPEGRHQPFRAHRLHQVVERVELECLDGVPVMGGDENDRGRALQRAKMARQLDAAHARHLDIKQQHLRRAPGEMLDDLQPVGRFAHDRRGDFAAGVGEQFPSAARGRAPHRPR